MNIKEKMQEKVVLAPYTSFKIGGGAKFFVEVETLDELKDSILWAEEKNEKFFILSGGTNILVPDKGVDGLVIKLNNTDAEIRGERLIAGAGANLVASARLVANNSLTGFEWAAGIPGSLGGAIYGNAGAYGDSTSAFVETVDVFDIDKKQLKTFSRNDCEFSYRKSIFSDHKNLLIWSATLRFKKGHDKDINILVNQYLENRLKSQPRLPSAGCVFKNFDFKYVTNNNASLAVEAEEAGVVKGGKLGAGWVVDRLGLKGKIIGGAKVSLEHANFIVNTGKATANDIAMLISLIKQQARDKYGLQLDEEIRYFGI